MTRKLFQEGGPLQAKDLGNDRFQLTVGLPKDEDGRVARECPDAKCSPGYFKIKPGTGVTGAQSTAYCPYCRHSAEPTNFSTREQVRYGKELVIEEAKKGLDRMVADALGLGPTGKRKLGGGLITIEMTYRPGTPQPVRRPYEDEVRRDVVCPHCTLDQTVFGLAIWCADCGRDIFLEHVAGEIVIARHMLGDIDRRRELLGKRVAAKDLENCLEDAVSIFEAAMKVVVRRALLKQGKTTEDVDAFLKTLGNAFQSMSRTRECLEEMFGYAVLDNSSWQTLTTGFEKRHPITHNLGVVERKFLERSEADERLGREVRVLASEVEAVLSAVHETIRVLYSALVRSGEA